MINISNLLVTLDNHKLLNNITCQIPSRKITTIVGKSGSGKTLLVKSILGLIEHFDGEVDFSDKNYKTAMVFQSSALLDSLTVFENLALPIREGKSRKLSKIEYVRIMNAINDVGLMDAVKKYPSQLSGGMKKRVAIARSICANPTYIFYDEPTTGLDPQTKIEIIDLIAELHRNNRITSVLVTHELDRFEKNTDYLIFIENGEILFSGEVDEFYQSEKEEIRTYCASK